VSGKFTQADKAHHEAGHAVIARALGVGVTYVALFSTESDNSAAAQTASAAWRALTNDLPAAYEIDAKVALAGPHAQHRYRPVKGRKIPDVWASDMVNAQSFIYSLVLLRDGVALDDGPFRITPDERQAAKAQREYDRISAETQALVEANWSAIERVAAALMRRPILTESDLDALIADRPVLVLP
jgi:hypothetical protein